MQWHNSRRGEISVVFRKPLSESFPKKLLRASCSFIDSFMARVISSFDTRRKWVLWFFFSLSISIKMTARNINFAKVNLPWSYRSFKTHDWDQSKLLYGMLFFFFTFQLDRKCNIQFNWIQFASLGSAFFLHIFYMKSKKLFLWMH